MGTTCDERTSAPHYNIRPRLKTFSREQPDAFIFPRDRRLFIQKVLIEDFLAFPFLEVYALGVNETNVCEKDTGVCLWLQAAACNVKKKTRILLNRP